MPLASQLPFFTENEWEAAALWLAQFQCGFILTGAGTKEGGRKGGYKGRRKGEVSR